VIGAPKFGVIRNEKVEQKAELEMEKTGTPRSGTNEQRNLPPSLSFFKPNNNQEKGEFVNLLHKKLNEKVLRLILCTLISGNLYSFKLLNKQVSEGNNFLTLLIFLGRSKIATRC
jgi:hypothetical protein